jgi:hypothetical protein
MTDATEDVTQGTDDISEGALVILEHLLDKAYAENASLQKRLEDERAKTRKADFATMDAKRRYNELVARLRFNYDEDV